MTEAKITFKGTVYECKDSETVLEVLLRNNIDAPYSCRVGVCQACMVQGIKGKIPEDAQIGLKDTLCFQNYFLACRCLPQGDMEINFADAEEIFTHTTVLDKTILTPKVCRLTLKTSLPFLYQAGQFVNVRGEGSLERSYSLASFPEEDSHLELHIHRMPNGQMSNWIFDSLKVGDSLDIQGPNGNCYYLPGRPEQEILLVGTGTGLSPLIGIARNALHVGHSGNIFLYHGSRHLEGLYLQEALIELADQFSNFHYTPCLSGEWVPEGYTAGRADDIAQTRHPKLSGWRVFLCGAPSMVKSMQKLAFLAGANIPDIYADPYELRELRKIKQRG